MPRKYFCLMFIISASLYSMHDNLKKFSPTVVQKKSVTFVDDVEGLKTPAWERFMHVVRCYSDHATIKYQAKIPNDFIPVALDTIEAVKQNKIIMCTRTVHGKTPKILTISADYFSVLEVLVEQKK